jgi:cell division protein FtsI/penicillin-binding protein 2
VTLNGVADHLVGTTRSQVFADELARRPLVNAETGEIVDLGGYRADRDVVGASGVERAREPALRGVRGVIERQLERETERRLDPISGGDTQLTIDIRLQSRIQALFAPESRLATIQQYQRGVDREGNPRGGPLPLGYELDGAVVVPDVFADSDGHIAIVDAQDRDALGGAEDAVFVEDGVVG